MEGQRWENRGAGGSFCLYDHFGDPLSPTYFFSSASTNCSTAELCVSFRSTTPCPSPSAEVSASEPAAAALAALFWLGPAGLAVLQY